jgi:maltose/maltodextrin transport system substrate-binding protein
VVERYTKGHRFGLGQVPGVEGQVGRPFVGVSAAFLNRASPNHDLAREFIERYLLTDEALTDMNNAKPPGVPALIPFYEKLARNNEHVRQLKAAVDAGQVMPNVPQMGRFFSAMGAALQPAADGRLTASVALQQAESNLRYETVIR